MTKPGQVDQNNDNKNENYDDDDDDAGNQKPSVPLGDVEVELEGASPPQAAQIQRYARSWLLSHVFS